MFETSTDVLIHRKGVHGLSSEEYAAALRDRLPEYSIRLASTPAEERALIETATVATGVSIDPELLADAERLRVFACTWAGTGHLPLEELRAADVAVTNASGVHAPNIAETVVGHILVFARRLYEGWKRTQRREWRHFQAHELAGSTVTVVGQGSIGQAIVERLAGFDVKTIGVRYTPSKGGPADVVIGFDTDEFHDALAETEYLVLASPLTETTRGLIDEAALDTLGPDAVLVNIGRGALVETDALVEALQSQYLRGAALDVTDPEPLPADHPLWTFDNVFITPHNSGHSPEHWPRLADLVAENVRRLAETESVASLDNLVVNPDDGR
jgi:phosphoglycerate dehydrogenase-like enzyme